MYLLLVPALIFAVGYVAGFVGYAMTRRPTGAFVAAMIVPLPPILLLSGFAFGFMREVSVDIENLIGAILLMLAVSWPFTCLGAWQYLLRRDRAYRK